MAPDEGRAGFTLVEMLVSLALASLVGLLTVQALRATAEVSRTGRRLGAQEEVQIVRDHLRRMLAEAVRRRPDGAVVPFRGGPDRFVATIQADGASETGGEVVVVLAMSQADGPPALLETRGPTGAAGTAEILLEPVAGLGFRYFGPLGQAGTPQWQANWDRPDRTPSLLEVTVRFPPGDGRTWPPLVLPFGQGS